MRLLNTDTGQFEEFADHHKVPYAILSHTWDSSGEQSCQELRDIQKRFLLERTPSFPPIKPVHTTQEGLLAQDASAVQSREMAAPSHSHATSPMVSIWDHPGLSDKIRKACAIARDHGYRYLWIDSCCIDKTSSSELSEAINSMYVWYRDAAMCYAFLADVPGRREDMGTSEDEFRNSRWFKRGWTLQELIAPRYLVFLSREWSVLGTKSTLIKSVKSATGIQPAILEHTLPLSSVSVATRMSWAAKRQTTRVEDEAYSLLGIFDINMPTLYGEGRRAFSRLQEEILRRIPDQSLLAWGQLSYGFISTHTRNPSIFQWRSPHTLLASKPADFSSHTTIREIPYDKFLSRIGRSDIDIPIPEYTMSPYGIRTQIPLVAIRPLCPEDSTIASHEGSSNWRWYLALLACETESDDKSLVARICWMGTSPSPGLHLLWYGSLNVHDVWFDLITLSPDEIERCHPHVHLTTVYLPLPNPDTIPTLRSFGLAAPLCMELSLWAKAVLHMQGYEVITQPGIPPVTHADSPDNDTTRSDSDDFNYYSIKLVKDANAINIECACGADIESLVVTIRLPASLHSAASVTRYDIWACEPTYSGPYILVECPTLKFRDSAGDTLALRLSVQQSQDWLHLHAQVTGENTERPSNRAVEQQGEEADRDSRSDSSGSEESQPG